MVRRFADMEIFVEIQENVRGSDAFIIQSTSFPANDHLMELLIITDALRRSSARRITAVIPYFGYARQDRKSGSRTPISAKLVANLITQAGVDRVMTLDLHAGQIQGFFDIPTDNLFASPVMVRDIKERFDLSNVMVVSPDVGGVVRARGLAKRINTPLAIIDKRRERAGESEVMNVIGDVAGHTCILIDDIVDSGGTLVNAADALIANGAKEVYAYITHGVLSGGAAARIASSKLKELVITDSIQPTEAVQQGRQHPHALDRRPDRAKRSAAPRRKNRCRACSTEPLAAAQSALPRSLNKMRTRGRGVELIGEILGFAGHQPVAEFHDAHGVRRDAVIAKYEFSDPEIAAADHSPDRKALLVWLNEPALLNVVPAADPLARLRIMKHGILVVDFMFDLEIVRVRSIPMTLQRRPHGSIIHRNLLLKTPAAEPGSSAC